jgi:CRP-like cAMP-binding protein
MASPSHNKLLSALSAQEYRRIATYLHSIRIIAESPLPQCGETRVYFPGSGVCSIQNRMSDGSVIEVASVGSEGVVGLPALGTPLPACAYTQVGDGAAEYMTLTVFERLCHDSELGWAVENYSNAFLESTMRLIVCNTRHPVQARCARWILGIHDRLQRARFELTQPFLAGVLGVSPRVLQDLISTLSQNHLLAYDASSITILDTIGLRRAACSCHDRLKRLYLPGLTMKKRSPPRRTPDVRTHKVVQMRPTNICTLCGLGLTSPHLNHSDCLRAIDKEIRSLIARVRLLTNQRSLITAEFMKKYEQFRNRQSV